MATKILMIEDEKDLADIYTLKLVQSGFEVVNVYDGKDAVEAVKKEMPTAVLLDMYLPNMDGYEILQVLRKDAQTKKTVIYGWSNFTQDKEIEKAKKLGVDEYLIKSDYTPETLAQKIKSLLRIN